MLHFQVEFLEHEAGDWEACLYPPDLPELAAFGMMLALPSSPEIGVLVAWLTLVSKVCGQIAGSSGFTVLMGSSGVFKSGGE